MIQSRLQPQDCVNILAEIPAEDSGRDARLSSLQTVNKSWLQRQRVEFRDAANLIKRHVDRLLHSHKATFPMKLVEVHVLLCLSSLGGGNLWEDYEAMDGTIHRIIRVELILRYTKEAVEKLQAEERALERSAMASRSR